MQPFKLQANNTHMQLLIKSIFAYIYINSVGVVILFYSVIGWSWYSLCTLRSCEVLT